MGDGGPDKFAEAVLWVLFTLGGLGYLAIYLISAPGATEHAQAVLYRFSGPFM